VKDRTVSSFTDGFDVPADEDWTFATADTRYMSHAFHAYPARMIPQVAKGLIRSYSKSENDVCIDPFCGSGTVLVESKLHGIECIGVDANPLAVLLAKVKSTPIKHEVLRKYADIFLAGVRKDAVFKKEVVLPPIKNLDFWFKPTVSRDLAIIRDILLKIEEPDVRDFFKVCFSITVRKVSNNRSGEFKLYRRSAEDLEKFNPDVVKVFSQIVYRNIAAMDLFYLSIKKDTPVTVVKGDTRQLLSLKPDKIYENSATLLVSSPPYGDSHTTVAYGQYSRYLSLWLGYNEREVMEVDKVGLGGRIYKNRENLESPTLNEILDKITTNEIAVGKRNVRASETYSFFKDLDLCFAQISKVMKQGKSHVCYVLGNRTVKRVKVPADKILIELAKKYGFRHLKTIERGIPNKHMPAVNSPENLSTMLGETMSRENIIVWHY
jgi:site-specific DNA-methyltransferase (cytosine-N4-specific)